MASAAVAPSPNKHLKCVAAPKYWMLIKLISVLASRPPTSPHSLRECLPFIVFLNRVIYALTGDEVKICLQQFMKVDGRVQMI